MTKMTGETDIPSGPQFEAMLDALIKARVFEVTHGKVVVNVHEGRVQSITVEERRYQHIAPKKGFNVPI